MSNVFAQLQAESEKQKQQLKEKSTSTSTHVRDNSRDNERETLRDKSRQMVMPDKSTQSIAEELALPTRDDIQLFNFQLRDELKVKVQAEVPHEWQRDLEDVARSLDVKKLELYRFIIGEFLGKVKRQRKSS